MLLGLLFVFFISFPLGCSRSDSPSDQTAASETSGPPEKTQSLESPKVLGSVPDFRLTDQAGQPFEKDAMDGTIYIATFIFTRCAATCPFQTAVMSELQTELANRGDLGEVKLLSFTVDPEFDTPEILERYGREANADFDHWTFLTGDRGTLWDLSKDGFKLPVLSERDADALITHSQNLILVDHLGNIRGYYAALSEKAKAKLRVDLETLLKEQNPDRDSTLVEIGYPEGVRNPPWLAARAAEQIKLAEDYPVRHDFRFTDSVDESGITFRDNVVDDVKKEFKAAHYDHGSGVAVADVDGDGLLDVYFVCQLGRNELWRNLGNGTFEDVTDSAGVAVADEVGTGASFADVDNDGDADLYVSRVRAPNRLFLNDGTGVFSDASESSGLDHVGHSSGAVFFDYDRDGLLDLLLTNVGKYTTDERHPNGYYVAYETAFTGHLFEDRTESNILFRNLGEGKFQNVNEQVGFDDVSWSGDATPIDANNDGWLDIYLLNMQGHDEYFENQQGQGFVRKSRELFPRSAWGTMGVKVFDYNRDGQLDLYVTDMHTDMVHALMPQEEKQKMRRNLPPNMLATDGNHILGNAFYRKEGENAYTEISDRVGAENYWPWGISVADLNADGFEDVFIAASMSYDFRYGINSVLLNDRGQTFLDSEFVLGVEPRAKGTAQPWFELDCSGEDADHRLSAGRSGRLLVWGAIGTRSSVVFDLDNDGDLDIVTNDFGGTPMVLTSDLVQQDTGDVNYLKIQLVGTQSNRDGLGSEVEIQIGEDTYLSVQDGKSGYLSQSRMPLYFGLGDADQVDQIQVKWSSGVVQVVDGPIDHNQTITIVETSKTEQ